MNTSRKYQNLVVWQKSMELVSDIYHVTQEFPDMEKFGLTAQLRRAAVSVPSNIAEGSGRGSDRDFVRFLKIAKGSLLETETQLIIAQKLKYTKEISKLTEQIQKVFAMLTNLINSLSSAPQNGASVRRPTSDVRPTN